MAKRSHGGCAGSARPAQDPARSSLALAPSGSGRAAGRAPRWRRGWSAGRRPAAAVGGDVAPRRGGAGGRPSSGVPLNRLVLVDLVAEVGERVRFAVVVGGEGG